MSEYEQIWALLGDTGDFDELEVVKKLKDFQLNSVESFFGFYTQFSVLLGGWKLRRFVDILCAVYRDNSGSQMFIDLVFILCGISEYAVVKFSTILDASVIAQVNADNRKTLGGHLALLRELPAVEISDDIKSALLAFLLEHTLESPEKSVLEDASIVLSRAGITEQDSSQIVSEIIPTLSSHGIDCSKLLSAAYSHFPVAVIDTLKQNHHKFDPRKLEGLLLLLRLHPGIVLDNFKLTIDHSLLRTESTSSDLGIEDVLADLTMESPEEDNDSLLVQNMKLKKQLKLLESINSQLLTEKCTLIQSLNAQQSLYQEYRNTKYEIQGYKDHLERLQAEIKLITQKHLSWEFALNEKLKKFRDERAVWKKERDDALKSLEESSIQIKKLIEERNEATKLLLEIEINNRVVK